VSTVERSQALSRASRSNQAEWINYNGLTTESTEKVKERTRLFCPLADMSTLEGDSPSSDFRLFIASPPCPGLLVVGRQTKFLAHAADGRLADFEAVLLLDMSDQPNGFGVRVALEYFTEDLTNLLLQRGRTSESGRRSFGYSSAATRPNGTRSNRLRSDYGSRRSSCKPAKYPNAHCTEKGSSLLLTESAMVRWGSG
jgi:hypothetical protein